MAGRALRRRAGVFPIHMALRADGGGVFTCERKLRRRVVELCALPLRGGVATLAGSGEAGALVIRIRGGVELREVTRCAILRRAGKPFAHMALEACGGRMLSGEREFRRCIVVERRAFPLCGGVARLAGSGEARRLMIRICRGVELWEVAHRALAGSSRVLAIDVTLGASGRSVLPGEGESRLRMIELRTFPLSSGVTGLARCCEPGVAVVRIGGGLIRIQMTGGAVLRRPRELVVQVALLATHRGVLPRERELCGRIVIEARAGPLHSGVARLAGSGESRCRVVRIDGVLVARQVTRGTVLSRARELVVHVALLAGDGHVLAGQSELRRGVIERRSLPLCGGMAHRAVGGEPGGLVIRIAGRVVSRQMATSAFAGHAAVLIVDVALLARRGRVLAGQCELRLRVIERRTLPPRRGVARLALGGERRRGMVGILRRLELLQMARGAILRQVLEDIPGMTLHTGGGGVLAGEREPRIRPVIELRSFPLHARVA